VTTGGDFPDAARPDPARPEQAWSEQAWPDQAWPDQSWPDESPSSEPPPDAGRVVPAYALTRGRTRSYGDELPIEALVTSTDLALRSTPSLQTEARAIIELAVRPTSVMEIGAALNVPVGVARVLVSDLANAGFLQLHLPPSASGDTGPGRAVLGRLLDGLRAR